MNLKLKKAWAGLVLGALSLGAASTSQAATFLTTSYTNSFDLGGNTADFSGSGSVKSWIYWYNTPGGNAPMYCHYGLDANGKTSTSGVLEVDSPFGTGGTQNVFFGTFGNQYGYDFSVQANLINYTNISFDIMVPKGTQPDGNGNFGSIGVGIINSSYGYEQFAQPTIPGAASNGWVHIVVPIDQTKPNLSTVPGLAFDFNNYGGYPQFPFTNYIDNLQLNLSPVKVPPPKFVGSVRPAINGLNAIATANGSPYNRYQVETVSSSGLGFLDQPSVTYSWNIQSFPKANGDTFQQHFFIAAGVPGPYDQAVDYNFANVIILTVQQAANGMANFDFRYKTNEPAGNGMVYNGTSPTNTTANPNGWPVQPFATLNAPTPIGNWSITFSDVTNVTVTGPGGVSTSFVFDYASAQLFQDPVTLVLGGQPNDASGYGQGVVYGSFAVSGNDVPFSDQFTNDTALDSSIWQDLSSDPNGDILVPVGANDWLNWTLPDSGFSLQNAATLNGGSASWADLSPTTIQNNGSRQALLPVASLLGTNQSFFRLIQRIPYQLQVLLPGETNAPNTLTGKGGTPTPQGVGAEVDAVVNLVDSTWHIISSSDSVTLTSVTDPSAGTTLPTALVGGTVTIPFYFDTAGSQTLTATDTTSTNILSNTSSAVLLQ